MKLKELRKNANLNQKDVASALGISTQVYSRYEREDHKADYDMLCKMANFFNVTIDELLGRTSTPGIFDDARVPKSEIQELYDQMTPDEQMYFLNSARGIVYAHSIGAASNNKRLA